MWESELNLVNSMRFFILSLNQLFKPISGIYTVNSQGTEILEDIKLSSNALFTLESFQSVSTY